MITAQVKIVATVFFVLLLVLIYTSFNQPIRTWLTHLFGIEQSTQGDQFVALNTQNGLTKLPPPQEEKVNDSNSWGMNGVSEPLTDPLSNEPLRREIAKSYCSVLLTAEQIKVDAYTECVRNHSSMPMQIYSSLTQKTLETSWNELSTEEMMLIVQQVRDAEIKIKAQILFRQ